MSTPLSPSPSGPGSSVTIIHRLDLSLSLDELGVGLKEESRGNGESSSSRLPLTSVRPKIGRPNSYPFSSTRIVVRGVIGGRVYR